MSGNKEAMGTESSPSQCTGQGTQQQKNPNRKQKFLEAEPKALGITQIGLCVYQIAWYMGVALASRLSDASFSVVFLILTVPGIIAGSLAIAAQNLHLPTLKACLGMQVLASLATVLHAFLGAMDVMAGLPHAACLDWSEPWSKQYDNGTTMEVTLEQWKYSKYSEEYTTCLHLRLGYNHLYAGFFLIRAALVVISCTLAIYCCKVVNCCSPVSKMPVITVQASPAQQ